MILVLNNNGCKTIDVMEYFYISKILKMYRGKANSNVPLARGIYRTIYMYVLNRFI